MPRADLAAVITPTPRRIPEPYLRAEITAFPLASEESFRSCLLELNPSLHEDAEGTGRLWRACEGLIAQHTGWSLDRLVAARDRGWFGPYAKGGRVSMLAYLRGVARGHLEPRAGVTQILHSTELSALDAVIHYRWLTLVLPEDMLLGALGVEPAPISVELDPPMLRRRLLDLGIAEIHQHVGAAMDFPLLWVSALSALATPDIGELELMSPGAPFDDGRNLVRWLQVAAIARCVLAEHLIRGGDQLQEFIARETEGGWPISATVDGGAQLGDGRVGIARTTTVWTMRRRDTLVDALTALISGEDRRLPELESLQELYAELHPTIATLADEPVVRLADAYLRLDPIAARLHLHGTNAGERWLLRKGLAYLSPDRPGSAGDTLFARVFWQTMRLRCQYYRAVVERPLTGGLQWFIRFYGRLGRLRDPLRHILPETAFQHAGGGQGVRALELRTSPSDNAIALGEQLLDFLSSWREVLATTGGNASWPEIGVVFHFVKERDAEHAWVRGLPAAYWAGTHDEPQKGCCESDKGRFVAYYAEQSRRAQAVVELLRAVPSCLWLLRGLDVATDELGIPTWVLVPLFRQILDESAVASLRDRAGPPLQITAHVGEDFRHLMEGLRRIYEHIHYVLGHRGGRLGHAMALGVDPQTWAESVGSMLMPAEERLWDLVWEWRLYSRYRIKPEYATAAPPGRIDALSNEVRLLAEQVYGQHHNLDVLAEAHHVLHSFLVPPHASAVDTGGGSESFTAALRALDRTRVREPSKTCALIERYLMDEDVFIRGQELIDTPVEKSEVDALTAVQNALRCGIGQSGIVVEVNPSSNMLIGDLLDLRRHPILRLFPPVAEPDSPPPVPIALGSDDPLTFSTRLLREYTLLYQSALASGYPERAVNDWLEAIRRTGMDARFTVEWFPSAAEKTQELINDLNTYLHIGCNYVR